MPDLLNVSGIQKKKKKSIMVIPGTTFAEMARSKTDPMTMHDPVAPISPQTAPIPAADVENSGEQVPKLSDGNNGSGGIRIVVDDENGSTSHQIDIAPDYSHPNIDYKFNEKTNPPNRFNDSESTIRPSGSHFVPAIAGGSNSNGEGGSGGGEGDGSDTLEDKAIHSYVVDRKSTVTLRSLLSAHYNIRLHGETDKDCEFGGVWEIRA
ncbi:hypothetical protein AYI68_g7216 [Smittium mucronatum]|uniref:Uncharacterized protein n=1 Tax=Smittium mucronatum TaxID=133383 RepID=A0A1R0GPD2_9FUNG|nr:hypothetical protein AYI68_g7216 [Smittium mucronatum]